MLVIYRRRPGQGAVGLRHGHGLAALGGQLVGGALVALNLAGPRPEHVGAASGALARMQNVANAIGVAIIGVLFFGTLHAGFADAFRASLITLTAILVSVAALSRLLPAPGEPS